MPSTRITYNASTNYTVSLASLASGSARQGVFVDNTTNRFLDVMLYLAVTLQAGTPTGDRAVLIWFYASEDGTNYTDNATGTDSPITLRTPTNLRGPWTISTPDAGALTYRTVIPSVGVFFGGNIPRRWGIVVENRTGIAFNASEATHIKTYSGLYLDAV